MSSGKTPLCTFINSCLYKCSLDCAAAIFAIVVLPKVVAVFYPEISVTVGYTEFRPGFMFFSEKEVLKWRALQGLVITPLDTNLVGAIVGMYFGGSLVKK